MKAEIIIPKGWKLVTHGRLREGDLLLDVEHGGNRAAWTRLYGGLVGQGVGNFYGVIRKVKPVTDTPEKTEVRLDRSTLQNYASCPFMGWAVETGIVRNDSIPALSGNEAHEALGAMVHAFFNGVTDAREITEQGLVMARMSNALVQPDVLEATRASLWKFARELVYLDERLKRNPADVLRYQGASGDHNGQLTAVIEPVAGTDCKYLLTSEVDLLMAGLSARHLFETDWKSGRTRWCATDVRSAFQFRFHAYLLFETYPDLECVSIRVWMSRFGYATGWVDFHRNEMPDIRCHILRALIDRERAMEVAGKSYWPAVNSYADVCVNCPCAGAMNAEKKPVCPFVASKAADIAADPQAYLSAYVAMDADLEARKKVLYAWAKKFGAIEAAGVVCGVKPPGQGKIGIFAPKKEEGDE